MDMNNDKSIESEISEGLTRRSFLGRGALAAGVALVGAGTLGISGCNTTEEPKNSTASGSTAAVDFSSTASYEVINTEALVIGSGVNAQSVAETLLKSGKNVLLVEKGPYRHSGTSGMSWDAFCGSFQPDQFADIIASDATANQRVFQKAIETATELNVLVYMINQGHTMPDRDETGKIIPYYLPTGCQSQFPRRGSDSLVKMSNYSFLDRTIITNFIVNDGKCVGAVGLHLPTGTYRIIRSKATIMAAGTSTWMYGWLTVSARTNATSDSTGDLDAVAFRNGLGIGNSEFASYDTLTISPAGLGYGFGAGITADPAEALFVTDNNGDYVFSEDDEAVVNKDWGAFIQKVAQTIQEGRGTENGGVYVTIGDFELRKANERNIELQRKFGIDPRSEPVEVAPEMFERGGTPITDENLMTELEGLFNGRSFSTGAAVWHNLIFGPHAGRCAAEYIDRIGDQDEADLSPAFEEIERVEEIRMRKPTNGIRPHEIRHNIQETCYSAMGVIRKKEDLDAAAAEFERIRKEDMANMALDSDSRTYNIEWKQAIENYNLLDVAEIAVRATLAREESRGSYLREDFPQPDDENWACMLVCRKDGDEMTFEKKSYEPATW